MLIAIQENKECTESVLRTFYINIYTWKQETTFVGGGERFRRLWLTLLKKGYVILEERPQD